MIGADDDIAAIDLSITFFSVVLVLFVFVAFNLEDTPYPETPLTIGQTVPTRDVVPPGWSPVNERGSFAVLSNDGLVVLDLAAIGRGILDTRAAYSATDAYQIFDAGTETAPNSFSLTLTFVPDAMPMQWIRETAVLTDDGDCPKTARSLVTVFVPRDAADLSPLLALGAHCELHLRIDLLSDPASDGTVARRIALDSQMFRAETMFR